MALVDILKTIVCAFKGLFRSTQKLFGLLTSFKNLTSMQLSVQGSFSFYKIPFDSLSGIRYPKNILRSLPSFQIAYFFLFPKVQSEP